MYDKRKLWRHFSDSSLMMIQVPQNLTSAAIVYGFIDNLLAQDSPYCTKSSRQHPGHIRGRQSFMMTWIQRGSPTGSTSFSYKIKAERVTSGLGRGHPAIGGTSARQLTSSKQGTSQYLINHKPSPQRFATFIPCLRLATFVQTTSASDS